MFDRFDTCPHLPDLLSDRQERDFDSSVDVILHGFMLQMIYTAVFRVKQWNKYYLCNNMNARPKRQNMCISYLISRPCHHIVVQYEHDAVLMMTTSPPAQDQ